MNQPEVCLKQAIVVIAGPTGAGKSSLAMSLASSSDLPPIEIISADSRQIYRQLNIGTDKIPSADRVKIPHHMLDIIEPDARYSAAEFAREADRCIRQIASRNALPMVVGGTGLYIRILTGGLAPLAGPEDAVRNMYRTVLEETDAATLYQLLLDRDAERAKTIDPSDTFRIIRALEILDCGEKDITRILSAHAFQSQPYNSLKIILNVDRLKLYKRIDERVDAMLKKGLVEEVVNLRGRFDRNAPGLSGIGYSQINRYLDGEIPLEEAVRLIKRDSRHYAKRQLTWFRKEPDARRLDFDPEHPEVTLETLTQWIWRFYEEWRS